MATPNLLNTLEADVLELRIAVKRLAKRVEHNSTSLDDVEQALADLTGTVVPPPVPYDAATALHEALVIRPEQVSPQAPTLEVLHAWVGLLIAPMACASAAAGRRRGPRWCRRWWEHPDAAERLEAIYRTYQRLRVEEDDTWLSVFIRDHRDPHLRELTDPYGPFQFCTPKRHKQIADTPGQDELPPLAQPAIPQ
ncbi:DUF4913 domain-containing protein [Pseudonocardiaceae bacterium YIM PH 21723]|nr:DUF4913 domain-containing protein [Pseudonocardiaceae bacterium YIM PH 21723]